MGGKAVLPGPGTPFEKTTIEQDMASLVRTNDKLSAILFEMIVRHKEVKLYEYVKTVNYLNYCIAHKYRIFHESRSKK